MKQPVAAEPDVQPPTQPEQTRVAPATDPRGPAAADAAHRPPLEEAPAVTLTDGRDDSMAVLISWLQAPFVAMQFLTVLPPVVRRPLLPIDLGRSETFFPITGALLGAVLVAADLALATWVAQPVRDVLLVALLAALTGALHLDGVIDTCDGLFASGGPARRLDIMRDPRAGAFGVVGIILLLALKLAALASLPPDARAPALLLAPLLGRWSIVLVTGVFPYARPEGMGRAFKNAVRWPHVAGAGVMASLLAWSIGGSWGVSLGAATTVVAVIAARWVSGRLGGLTGDTYGALCELTEAGILVGMGLRVGNVGV